MGEMWVHIGYILLGLGLSAVIGIEREIRHKSAGLRTHALVGTGAALFMVVSKYGFADVTGADHVVLDPSRIAAQIVSGIGFLGGGLIFVRRDAVRGLTTAAGIWLAAAVGTAAGAELPAIAAGTTVAYLLVAVVFPPVAARIPRTRSTAALVRVSYADGRGLLRDIVRRCTSDGFQIADLNVLRSIPGGPVATEHPSMVAVEVELEVIGRRAVELLLPRLGELSGVVRVGVVRGDAD